MRSTARAATAASPPHLGVDLSRVRHPDELRIVISSAAANAALVAAAIVVIVLAPEWVSTHPQAAQLLRRIQVVAIAAVLILPAIGFLRAARWMTIRLNSVRVGPDQLPALHAILQRQCRVLGIAPPELYVSADRSVGLSGAIALGRGGRRVIILGEKLFDGVDDIRAREHLFEFFIAHELGRILLGHASWWSELLLGYLKRVPVLRLPLVTVETYSRDRMAAILAPESVATMAVCASGGEIFDLLDLDAYVRDALAPVAHPTLARVAARMRGEPHLSDRLRELQRSGLLQVR